MMKTEHIELTDETITLFQRYGTIINTKDGKTYYFFPYWLECTPPTEFDFNMHRLGQLPEELIEYLRTHRDI